MSVIGRPFVKGISGNPGGRPKGRSEVNELALKWSPEALRTLMRIMRDEEEETKERIRAAEIILDRGLGKVAELPEEKRQTFPFLQPLSEAEVQLLERAVKTLPEDSNGNLNGNGVG